MNQREKRGKLLAKMGGQIAKLDDANYVVRSQSSASVYDVTSNEYGWTCTCPDHIRRNVACKHIHAVQLRMKRREPARQELTVKEVDLDRCKFCDSDNVVRHGIKRLKKGDFQRFKCMDCLRHFIHNLGFEGKRATAERITTAVELVFAGLSTRKTATVLRGMGVKASHMTVMNWATEYGRLMERYMEQKTPQVGEEWRTDEVYMAIKGKRRYLFAMLDSKKRYWLATLVAEHKGNDDVEPLFRAAKKHAGKVPDRLISDGASNFAHAHKRQFASKNFLHKESFHVSQIHMAGSHNNNQMESFNCNTVRLREKVTKGLKRDDSVILTGMRTYHNHFRPHEGLAGRPQARRRASRSRGTARCSRSSGRRPSQIA